MTTKDLERLCRNDHAMVRWICRVKPTDTPDINALHTKLGVRDLKVLVRQRRLRWFGHVMQSSDEINRVRTRQISGKRSKACNMKKWDGCVKNGLKEWGLTKELTQNRDLWISSVRN